MQTVKLTQYSHGAGCGCKIAPALLESILQTTRPAVPHPNLLVGYDSRDDAAAYDLGNGTCVLSTTDFFMPIVDDPFTFGRIAATNALSDIYAMGGRPLMAISVFGWPLGKLPLETGRQVIDGGRAACEAAGIPLAGGHSIDSLEPIFGLAVTGLVENRHLRRNDTAEEDCEIFLTKPLGIGILSTAQKMGKIAPGHLDAAIEAMCTLNDIGAEFATLDDVTAMTDVTGFGLLGHLLEICEGSGVSATIHYDRIKLLPHVEEYLAMGCIPGGTRNNFKSYGGKIGDLPEARRWVLCDPQTSGGLLCFVSPSGVRNFRTMAKAAGLKLESIGRTRPRGATWIDVV